MLDNLVYNLVSAEVVLVSFKITKRTMRPDMSYIRCCSAFLVVAFKVSNKAINIPKNQYVGYLPQT